MNCLRNRVLCVDLSARRIGHERVPDGWLERYLGGKGLGARYLYDRLEPGTDALSPANLLGFFVGPLTGYLPGDARYAAVTKSPLTGTFLDSYAGGSFPAALAGALPDHAGVLVTGAADEPVRLVVEDGDARLEPSDEWGLDAVETDRAIEGSVACVGPAGENRVGYATIASDGGDHHAGRGGAGAVMGAKRLKAVVARGDPPVLPPELGPVRAECEEQVSGDGKRRWLAAGGTVESVDFAAEVGALPANGWRDRGSDGEGIGVESAREASAGREREDDDVPGDFRVPTSEGETVTRGATPMTLGAGLGIDEFDAVAELGGLCDRLALDVISAGNAVAWAALARDAGLLESGPAFGDPESVRALIEAIAAREGPLADSLADGVAAAAATYEGGGDSGDADASLVPTVKRMALPAYDPRGSLGMALAYATSDRGACHRRALPLETEVFEPARSPAETAAAVATEQDVQSALWCLVADDFLGGALADDLGARWLTALGHPVDPADVRRVGERTWTLTRLFNVREGFERKSDALPAFFADAGEDEGDGEDEDGDVDRGTFEAALGAYYERRGWDREGRPTPGTCRRLRLDVAVPAGASGSDEEDGAAERGTTGQETAGYETADGGRETDLDST